MSTILNQWKNEKDDNKFIQKIYKAVEKIRKKDHFQAQVIHEEVFTEMDCLTCANCCKSIPPMVSNTDAKRIAKHLGLTKKAFLDSYTQQDDDGDTVMKTSPCTFLAEDNKCNIYEVRPSACRAYPHSGDELFYKNLSHHKRNMKYCPGLMDIMKRLGEVK